MATKNKKHNRRVKKVCKTTKRKKATRKAKRKVKKKTRPRDKIKNVALDGRKFSKIKQEYHDIDYAHLLTDKEKEWLSRFMEEDLGARLNHPGPKIYRKKADKKACYDRNNARNRDMYSLARATGLLNNDDTHQAIEAIQEKHLDAQDIEDRLIDEIDSNVEKKKQS